MSRALSSNERAVVARLLRLAGLERSGYASELAALHVVGRCRCGCASVDFIHLHPVSPPAGILVDAYGRTPEGDAVGVLLWENQGHLSALEIYSMWTESAGLPVAGSLTLDHPDPPQN